MSDIHERFVRETATHAMTVLHDAGLYRHLRFQAQEWQPPLAEPQKSPFYWFDLITAPGVLIFRGDGDSFVFARTTDMFQFFRGQRINPGYWAEKVTDGRDRLMTYDQSLFEARVKEEFVAAARDGGVPSGTGRALRRDVLNDEAIYCEHGAREALDAFEYQGFRFADTWEWGFRDYDWWFLWALHGIVWGIAQYDAHRRADRRAS